MSAVRWTEDKTCWFSYHPHGTPGWTEDRYAKLPSSRLAKAIGLSQWRDTPEVEADYMCGLKVEVFTEEARVRMKRGSDTEETAAQFYGVLTGTTPLKVGAAIPKNNRYKVSSVDRLVGEGLLEIKCPMKLPQILDLKLQTTNSTPIYQDPTPPRWVPIDHYIQMQDQMQVTGRPWCDYLVYNEFINVYLKPRIIQNRLVMVFPPYVEAICPADNVEFA
jgi:hypothetical protein